MTDEPQDTETTEETDDDAVQPNGATGHRVGGATGHLVEPNGATGHATPGGATGHATPSGATGHAVPAKDA